MLRWIRIPLGLVLILSVSGGYCSRPIRVGLGWLGWLGRNPAGLDRPWTGCPLRRRRNVQRADSRCPLDQRGYVAAMEPVPVPLERRGNPEVPRQEELRHSEQQELATTRSSSGCRTTPPPRTSTTATRLNAALDQLSDPQNSELLAQNRFDADSREDHRRDSVPIRLRSRHDHHEQPERGEAVAACARDRAVSPTTRKSSKRSPNRLGEKMKTAISRLRRSDGRKTSSPGSARKLAQHPLADPKRQLAAERFVKTLAGLVKLLEKPDTREVLDQLRKASKPRPSAI